MHVRQLIKDLDYTELIKTGVIPKILQQAVGNGSHLKCFGSNYSASGIYMEYLVDKMLQDLGKLEKHPLQMISADSAEKLDPEMIQNLAVFNSGCYTQGLKELRDIVAYIFNISLKGNIVCSNTMKNMYTALDSMPVCVAGLEIVMDGIQGHPDLASIDAVYDVKATRNFNSMRKESILQILCYVALLRAKGRNVNRCGVILPLQACILETDVSNWDSSEFLMCMFQHYNSMQQCVPLQRMLQYRIGAHFPLEKSVLHTLQTAHRFYGTTQVPIQIFLASPTRHQTLKLSQSEIQQVRKYVDGTGCKVYIHAPYYINLCKPRNRFSTDEKGSWSIKRLQLELRLGAQMGFKGVVFHTGKSLDLGLKEAKKIFAESLKKCLKHATPECPLLVETPAGQGTELYYKLRPFARLCKRNSNNPCFGICIDTCHIFAAGYNPDVYLDRFTRLVPIDIIKLIHLNGSKGVRKSRIDRHHNINYSSGKIPINSLVRFVEATLPRIPMVTE